MLITYIFRFEKSLSIFINYACNVFLKIFCARQTFLFPFNLFLCELSIVNLFCSQFLKFTCGAKLTIHLFTFLYSIRESNPCFLLERQASWTVRRIERFCCELLVVNFFAVIFINWQLTIYHSLFFDHLTRSRTWTTRVHFLHAAITLSAVWWK